VSRDAGYQPTWRAQLNTYDEFGSFNCTAYAAGFAVDYTTFGDEAPTGALIRRLSSEPIPSPSSPGLNLDQVAKVARDRYDVALTIHRGIPVSDLIRAHENGAGAIWQISYAPIRTSRFSGSRDFSGGHAVFVPPGIDALDPLADGRRPGIYKYHGEKYDIDLLANAAGSLVIGTKNGRPYTVRMKYGPGYAWAALTPSHEVPRPKPVAAPFGDEMFSVLGTYETSLRIALPKGTPLYDSASANPRRVTAMSEAGSLRFLGNAVRGYGVVIARTGAPYPDKKSRPTGLFVKLSAGKVTSV